MNLYYYIKNKNRIYTLKSKIDGEPTKSAHYKFKKTKDVIKTNRK